MFCVLLLCSPLPNPSSLFVSCGVWLEHILLGGGDVVTFARLALSSASTLTSGCGESIVAPCMSPNFLLPYSHVSYHSEQSTERVHLNLLLVVARQLLLPHIPLLPGIPPQVPL